MGVHVEDSDTGAGLTVYSSYYMFNEAYAGGSTFGNIDLLINNINVLAEAESNTVAFLPLTFLVIGIIRVVSRRKRG